MDDTTYPMKTASNKREGYLRRYGALKSERSSWITHWSDLSKHILPRNGRFFVSDRNRTGRDRYNSIYDNTATRSQRVLSAGMMAGVTSPARPWFRLTTPDPDLSEFYPVRAWLDNVVDRMQRVFARSNVYRALHQAYEELSTFGTACVLVLPDFNNVIHCYPITAGEYCLQQDYQGRVVALYREFQKTVGEVVKEFGYENCSIAVQQAWNERQHENTVDILHVIEPRGDQERDFNSPDAKDMPYRSCYLELGGDEEKLLRESGFERFPVLAPRWQVAGGDVYGTSPGMEALGDIRQLQQEQLRKGQAIDYKTKPPLQVPSRLANQEHEFYPSGVSYYEPGQMLPFDQVGPNGGIRTAFEVNLQLDHLLMDIQDVRMRIQRAFYEDLFLMLANAGPNTRMTATEVAERHEEKLLMLGPVLERLHNELLQPLIDITFDEMLAAGAIPPPPPELYGVDLSVEFVSILAQAQRAIGSNSIDRFMGNVMQLAQVKPEILDKVNFDKWVDNYSQMLGVDTELVVDDDTVRALREARAKAQAAAEQVNLQQQAAAATRDLASSPTGQGQQNALTDVMSQLTGYSNPTR
jgi:hypothetical protein